MNIKSSISAVAAAVLLSACGSSSSTPTTETPEEQTPAQTTTKTISGVAVDGYLDGSIVTIGTDTDTATTNSLGRWSLTYTSTIGTYSNSICKRWYRYSNR